MPSAQVKNAKHRSRVRRRQRNKPRRQTFRRGYRDPPRSVGVLFYKQRKSLGIEISMPKGTRVYRCVQELKDKQGYGSAIAICQTSTKQSYQTGKPLSAPKKRKLYTGNRGGRFYKKKGKDGKMRKVYV